MDGAPRHHWLVAPPLDGPITGGTLYNRFLVEALRRCGDAVSVVDTVDECPGFGWVDSLYLPEVVDVWARRPLGLLAHYLPSVFAMRPGLESFEAAALDGAAALLCTGSWMRDKVATLSGRAPALVEPGIHTAASITDPEPGPVTAVLVGTVTPRKGPLALLEALRTAPPRHPWRLQILGDLDADRDYAQRCIRAGDDLPVEFCGALPPTRTLTTIARAHVLLSAAAIESYGMAIAEAQACAVPVIARAGGHVARLVARVPSDVVCEDVTALARTFCELVDAPDQLARMRASSRKHAPQRSWATAAAEFRALAPHE